MTVNSLQQLCCIISLAISAKITAQNLVINPDFEEVEVKPYFWPKITSTKGWQNGNGGTVDFFNKRACKYENGIPENYMGQQNPYNGDRYAGIIAYYEDGVSPKRALRPVTATAVPAQQQLEVRHEAVKGKYAEYLQCPLSSTLIAGSTYTVSFRASLADKSARAVAGLGAYLSAQPASVKSNGYNLYTPQIAAADVIEDKNNWSEVSGSFVAKGDEKYILIGAFKSLLKSKKVIPDFADDNRKAYYYIDAVSVILNVVKPEVKEATKPAIDFSEELADGKSYILKNVKFESGKSVLLPESYPDLEILANWLKESKTAKLVLSCHTDRSGSEPVNQKLSEERAVAVKKYLISKEIEADRIKTKGYGSSKLLNKDNITAKENRRVEVSIAAK